MWVNFGKIEAVITILLLCDVLICLSEEFTYNTTTVKTRHNHHNPRKLQGHSNNNNKETTHNEVNDNDNNKDNGNNEENNNGQHKRRSQHRKDRSRKKNRMKKEEKQPKIIYQRFIGDDYFYDDFTEEELYTPTSEEKRLTKFLVARYKRAGIGGRPLMNSTEILMVRFGLAMIQMDLDERQNQLTVSVWCRYRWRDDYLRWDPTEFGGVKQIRLTTDTIWIPDIMLYNTADTYKLERDVMATISYEGEVLWIPHRVYKSSCSVNVANYPFDTQSCFMTFGSWAYHGNEIDLGIFEDMEMLDISDLERESTEWDIIDKMDNRSVQYYDCCDDPYVTLTFSLTLKRKLVFSSFILTLPCIFLACMTLVVFWLPPERPDRTSLAMSLFSSFLLLLLILVEAAPPTASSVPTLGLYYCFNMVIIMLSIFLSAVVINVSRRGESLRPVPNWLRTVAINGLSRVFCARIERRPRDISRTVNVKRNIEDNNSKMMGNDDMFTSGHSSLVVNNGVMQNEIGKEVPQEVVMDHSTFKLFHTHFLMMEKGLRGVESKVGDVISALKEKDLTREIRELKIEWQIVAMTLDRFFFLIFLISILVSLALMFPRPYQLQFY